ncbi:MAG: YgaP family membrane protein [Candidatus Acidiferrales bacterium]
MAIVACVLGAIAVVTGLVGFCPAWAVSEVNTCATKDAKPVGSRQ